MYNRIPSHLIDNEAKLQIKLFKTKGNNGSYLIGKVQFPGLIYLTQGISFMVFASEEDSEEMHIGFMKEHPFKKRNEDEQLTVVQGGEICVDLIAKTDKTGNTFYMGELKGMLHLPLDQGLFFKIFLTEGREEVVISPLDPSRSKKRSFNNQQYVSETG